MWQTGLFIGLISAAFCTFIFCSIIWLIRIIRSGKFREYSFLLKAWHSKSYIILMGCLAIQVALIIGFISVFFIDIALSETSIV